MGIVGKPGRGNGAASLCALSVFGSALCRLTILIVPSLDIPGWVVLALVAAFAGIPAALDRNRWLLFAICPVAGTTAGLYVGFMLWPIDPPVFAIGTFDAACASAFGAALAMGLPVPEKAPRKALWGVLVVSAAFGPLGLVLTPPLVAHRIALNERAAGETFASLKRAVERAAAAGAAPTELCDGSVLMRNSNGLAFSDEDWQRIVANYVLHDGYGFMVYCRANGQYTIDAEPVRPGADGVRHFCTDESGKLGCGMTAGPAHGCTPCAK